MGVRLPAEYQEVQYIEGTGTQYIVTDINLSTVTNPSVDWTLKVEITAINKTQILAGADDDLKQIVVMDSTLRYDWCSKSTTKFFYTKFKLGSVFTIMQKDGFLWLDNESHEITTTSTSALKFGLFCKTITNNVAETSTISNMKLYSFEVKQDFTDIAKYVPCYRKADSKPGIYDLVTKQFFTNAGTGADFTVGPDVIYSISPWLVARRRFLMRKPVRLPAEYQEIEYIESTGEQVINLNIDPRGSDSADHFKMYIKMRPSIAKTSDNYFFGANVNFFTFEYYDYPNRGYYFNLGTSTVLFPHNKSVGGEDVEYLITCDSGIATVTGTYDGTANYTYRIGQGPLGIFSRYNKDYYSTMRLYQLQFWQGESYPCIGKYIPCYRKFDNKPGLYDLVTRAFYTNAGTGEFIVGPDVN